MVISGLLILFWSIAHITLARPLEVFVSILPQKYFVEKIGGDSVEVSVMVQPGASPATYEPKPKQMVALATSDIYFAIGVPFLLLILFLTARPSGLLRTRGPA